jgi:predicted N-acetyltransferase YhbS
VRIRQIRQDSLDAALAVVTPAFIDEPAVVDLVRDLAAAGGFSLGLALLAEEDDGTPIGFVLLTPARVEGADVRAMCLAPLAVVPERQRTGVGTALVREALRLAEAQAVFVLGSWDYYGRFGFAPAFPAGLDTPLPIPEEHYLAWQAIELEPNALSGVSGRVRMMPELEEPRYWS